MVQCQNNLKQIGMAIALYSDTYREIPRITAWKLTQGKQLNLALDQQASWLYEVSPFVEARMDPKFQIDSTQPIDAEDNRYVVDSKFLVFLCPVNSNTGPSENFTHYVGITGVGDDAAMFPLSNPRCGFFGYHRKTTFRDIKDGVSNTLAAVETMTDNGPWAVGGHGTARGLDLEGTDYLGETGQFNSRHHERLPYRSFLGTNVCFGDGHVRNLSGDVSPTVFEALATIAGDEEIPTDF
jgi:prepilin-type processing-associated H-X9-DG protein